MDKRYSKFYQSSNNRNVKKDKPGDKKKRFQNLMLVGVLILSALLIFVAGGATFIHMYKQIQSKDGEVPEQTEEPLVIPDIIGTSQLYPDLPITEDFLTVNEYSRPGLALSCAPQYIVIHYTANPGSTAWDNRNYFENLKDSGQTYASSNFVIGLDGQIIQCVPCNEMAYCSNSYNEFSLSIEMCHPDETGNFNDETYNSCVYLVAHLMNYYHLDMDRLIRHYDVTGKDCPKYFVEHTDRWSVFKGYVEEYREQFREEDEKLYKTRLASMNEE